MALADDLAKLSPAAKHVRILTLDVERSPGLFWSWDPMPKFLSPDKMIEPPRIICFAAKWIDGDPVVVDERDGHEKMIRKLWDLMTDADVVVSYNGHKADIPWINEHFLDYGLGPAAPFKHVDLIKTNRARWNLPYRRLDYLAGRVLDAAKQPTDFQLWIDCLKGDKDAWDRMRSYNANDVVLTENLFLELLPWLVDMPHMGMLISDDEGHRCYACGTAIVPVQYGRKPARAHVRAYHLYRCERCGAWNRSTLLTGRAMFTRPAR